MTALTVAEQIDPLLRAAALRRLSRAERADVDRAQLLGYIGRALDAEFMAFRIVDVPATVAHVPTPVDVRGGLWAPPSDEIVSHYLTDEEMARGLFRDQPT